MRNVVCCLGHLDAGGDKATDRRRRRKRAIAPLTCAEMEKMAEKMNDEEETKKNMVVLSASDTWSPEDLTFDPTNGPEDFQELVFPCLRGAYTRIMLFLWTTSL